MSYAYAEPPRSDLRVLVNLVATGRLPPTIGLVAGWSQLGEVLAALDQRRLSGNAVLTVD